MVWALNAVGILGFLLIVYAILKVSDPNNWNLPKVDSFDHWISNVVTLLAVLITAYSVYFRPNLRPADWASTHIAVPLFITPLIALAVVYMATFKTVLPDHALNGLAIMGLVGAIFRLLPFTEQKGFE